MEFLDLYYRVLKEMKNLTLFDKDNLKILKNIATSSQEKDYIETKRTKCIIDEDWVIAIENGLPYVSKAIDEGRQFILSEGSVVPIEKVKKVSKASTVHLAKHSNFITRLPKKKTDPLVPDKIFMEEKLSEFAVYENKFLYMLLIYLRDFVQEKMDKIQELGNSYHAEFKVDKDIHFYKRDIVFSVNYSEDNHNSKLTLNDEKTVQIIERIEDIQHVIVSLLSTDLMTSVSKVAMIKPPITKTNVLKMDVNFKNAVALYEYIAEYQGDGYQVEELKNKIKPFPENIAISTAELANLTAFFTMMYGNKMTDMLERNYIAENERIAEIKSKEEKERIAKLKQKGDIYEYVQALEKRNVTLEQNVEKLKTDCQNYKYDSDKLKDAERQIGDMSNEIITLNNKNSEIANELEQTKINAKKEREELELKHEQILTKERLEHEKQLFQAKDEYEKNILESNKQHEEELKSVNDKYVFASARLKGLESQFGVVSQENIDYTSKEDFLELEKEYLAFTTFFNDKWKNIKKKIRVDNLGKKLVKMSNEKAETDGQEK